MTDLKYPIEMVNGVPVVAAPAEIDLSNAGWLDAVLREATARGHERFVVDMTGTQFCDSAGLTVLVRAHKQALAGNGELRLVLPASGSVPRIFTLTGLDQLIPHFTGLEQAVAQVPDGRVRPRGPDPPPGCVAVPSATAQGREGERNLWWIAGIANSAALCSCRAVSMPGFAVSAAGPAGTGSIWAIRWSSRARCCGRSPR